MIKIDPVSVKEMGEVKELKRSIVKIKGLSSCMVGQLIAFAGSTKGLVMGFNEKESMVLLLGGAHDIKVGERVYSEAESFTVPVGDKFLGRIVNALCEPIDAKGKIDQDAFFNVFRDSPGVIDRVPIDKMLVTGIRIIDSCLPIGMGQRQLIMGDRMTGKTTIAIDAVLSQKGKGILCIYCCVGRDYASLEKTVRVFKEKDMLKQLIVVAAASSSPIGEQYLAPYSAATLGDYFMHSGRDVLVVFDDLTKHAWTYRELSLLLERPPGREAYPGDIFYLHAQLMERAARLSEKLGGGSMTFLPIADTLQGDIAGFIPTNLISMTDGQVYLNSALFAEGLKPAVDLGLSVSRIGMRVLSRDMKEAAKDIGLEYLQYRELLKATKLKTALSEEMGGRLRHGEKIGRIFVQERNRPSPISEQFILFYALKEGALDLLPDDECENFKRHILEFAAGRIPDVVKKLDKGKDLSDEDKKNLKSCIVEFFKKGK